MNEMMGDALRNRVLNDSHDDDGSGDGKNGEMWHDLLVEPATESFGSSGDIRNANFDAATSSRHYEDVAAKFVNGTTESRTLNVYVGCHSLPNVRDEPRRANYDQVWLAGKAIESPPVAALALATC
jgi:hypothetical protein